VPPLPLSLSAQERNRDVDDPGPRARARPRAPTESFTSRFRVSGSEREVRAAACQIASRRAARSRTRGGVISSGLTSRNRAGMHVSDRLFRWLPSPTPVSCMRRPLLAARLSGSSCPRHWPRVHRQNRGKAMTDGEAVAFVETKRRARALRRARPYLASRP
jgi:hypothetical protein